MKNHLLPFDILRRKESTVLHRALLSNHVFVTILSKYTKYVTILSKYTKDKDLLTVAVHTCVFRLANAHRDILASRNRYGEGRADYTPCACLEI